MKKTEQRNPNTTHIDTAPTEQVIALIQAENYNAVRALDDALPSIAAACDAIVAKMKQGGRLLYIGAGTSGRLGVVDASECPPTYGVSPDLVVGIIAGGKECMFRAAEAEEDQAQTGVADVKAHRLTEKDTLVGISAAGDAQYVLAALQYANSIGATTVAISSNEDALILAEATYPILTDTGAEVITGSTRMKAGTAQKMVLNMLSTTAMIQMGCVYENLMVNMKAKNKKLLVRMENMIMEIHKCTRERAKELLTATNYDLRRAIEEGKQ